jgi:hypothetical protein
MEGLATCGSHFQVPIGSSSASTTSLLRIGTRSA